MRGLWAAGLLLLAGCFANEGSGTVVVETFDHRDFTEVALTGAGRLVVTGGDFAVAVSAEDDVMPSVRVTRKGRRLVLGRNIDWFDGVRPTVPVEYRVALPAAEAVRVSGSGEATIGGLAGPALRLVVSGAGDIRAGRLDIDDLTLSVDGAGGIVVAEAAARTINGEISGAGNISVGGEAERLELDVSGAGVFRGGETRLESARAQVTGAGKAFVWARTRLRARVTGAGQVSYRGSPEVDASTHGAGRVSAVDDAAAPAER